MNNLIQNSEIPHLETNYITKSGKRKYIFNLDFFKKIDSPEKAQVLGFIYADGCNQPKKGTVKIAIQYGDKNYLKDINRVMESNIPIKFIKRLQKTWQDQARLSIYSVEVCKDLIKLGCVPKKSLILKFPDKSILPPHLISHFIRGYFDGDGCITQSSRRNIEVNCSICGTLEFCESMKEILFNTLSLKSFIIYNNPQNNGANAYVIFILGGYYGVKKFLDWIYKDSCFHLERKYFKYKELCDKILVRENEKKNDDINYYKKYTTILELIKSNKSKSEIATILNCSTSKVYYILRKYRKNIYGC